MLSVNYAGTFDFNFSDDKSVSPTDHLFKADSGHASVTADSHAHDTIVVPDAQLLFAGDFNRLGTDLVLSKDGHEFVVHDYFRSEKRATLASPDGANLTGNVVEALTGHVQYAQAGDAPSAARDIGQVSKLVGTATALRNGVLIELHSGDRVYKGDVVQAGASSSCSIVFIDGTVFGLSANAKMVLNEMVYEQAGTPNSALISLVRGTITFVAGETAKHGDMKVDTPVATMGIRGTAVLVEIGFELPTDGNGPPVNFQVLVEPDGTTGSYVLYSKTNPGQIIGTIDKSGQVYSVSGDGTFSNLPSPELTQIAVSIIQQVFQQRFPGYVPDHPVSTPQSGGGAGSTPANPPGSDIPQFHNDTGDAPVIIPITIKVPDGSGGTKTVTIPVGVGVADVAPTITRAGFTLSDDGTAVLTPSNIGIHDPDNTSFTFTVTATGGTFELNINGNWVATTTFTTADLAAGHVRFVADGSGNFPAITIVANDGHLNSTPFDIHVNFNVDAPCHLVEAGAHGPGHSFSIEKLSIGNASYDYTAMADHGWTENENGTWSHDETYGKVILDPNHNTLIYFLKNSAADSLTSADHIPQTASVYLLSGPDGDISSQINITFIVDGRNDAPVAHNDTAHIDSGHTVVSGDVLTNDTDVDTAHTALSVSSAVHGISSGQDITVKGVYGELVIDKATGDYTYTLGATRSEAEALSHLQTDQHATDTFFYTASDGSANSNLAKLSISFDKPDDCHAPVAHSDHLIISAGAFERGPFGTSSVSFDNSALLGNDKDLDGNQLYVDKYISDFFSDGHASSSFNGDDTIYSLANFKLPGTGHTLHDGFNYKALDQLGETSNLTHVDVTVVGANPSFFWWAPKTYTLESTCNNDVLIGGDYSKENFVFKSGSVGHDTVIDFTKGQDKIVLDGFSSVPEKNDPCFADWLSSHVTDTAAGAVIHLDDHDTVLLANVQKTALTANDFIIHPGGSGPVGS